jgi:essential nuclear protein 1
VVEVYTLVGKMLHSYKSGKLPKALKMLPHLRNWEEVLWLTRPDEWSACATFACTRIFASNLNEKMAQVSESCCSDSLLPSHK